MKLYRTIILSIMFVVASSATIFAYVIGSDYKGIICFENNINPLNNVWITLDLDFDGRFEEYYFNKDGYLECNKYINEYYVNEYGQKVLNGSPIVVDVDPNISQTLMIDNITYYYINKVKSEYTKNWEIDENNKARVTIQIPEIVGENTLIANQVNEIIKDRGLQLLKLYAREEVYKKNARKIYISIDKFDNMKPHILNFIPNFNCKFYFVFTVIITSDKNKNSTNYIALSVDRLSSTCEIQSGEYKNLNHLKYIYDVENESVVTNDNYNSRYEELVKEIKDEYKEKLQEYLDNAEAFVSEYENNTNNKELLLRTVQNYINNIENIYNVYDKKSKNYKKAANLDEDTYNKLQNDMLEILKKYKIVLDNMLVGEINEIKEGINSDKMKE
ncbi:MAG: hypothetical protein Q4F88_06225 [Eubacteriales bacterium]|nr:hypothetical protein [Eubacteriales bacterium]